MRKAASLVTMEGCGHRDASGERPGEVVVVVADGGRGGAWGSREMMV